MNQRIDFTQLGGLPVTQYTLKYMQDSYRGAFAAIAKLVGDKVILTGVEVVGGNVTDGWITYNGEVIPFVGAGVGADVNVSEASETRLFNDNSTYPVYFKKTATIGAPATFAFSELKRIGTLLDRIVPTGLISMWSGALVDIPSGWALCDGTNGTPDLSGKFIAGYDAGDPDFDMDDTGGEKEHTLTIPEMPAHTHGVTIPKRDLSNAGDTGPDLSTDPSAVPASNTFATSSAGGGDPHNNLPPYYTLAYIMKLAS